MTAVERVEVERLSAPLHTPFVTALRRATSVESVLVRVTDSDGRVGYGEAPANGPVLGTTLEGNTAVLEGPLRDAVLGRAVDPRALWPRLDRAVLGHGAAKSALDCALHGLGGAPAVDLPTVVTLPVGEPDDVAAAAAARVAEGFTDLKLKVGTDPALDRARVRAARAAAPGAALRIDANQGWDAHTALAVLDDLADQGLELVEQPVPARDLLGLAHVRRHAPVPVLADESVFGLEDLVAVIRLGAADLVNLKLAKAGGLTPARELARVARQHGLGVTVGCMLEGPVGVAAAARLAAEVGCDVVPDLDGAWWLRDPGPVAYPAGRVRVGRMDP
ncbi:dipeptide epimerase [Nocardioides anomalus]|uniref:Dipeptide epimerase n=1 Tax=Nocardioides anomalus TaxID=2712223 RepID=A0A6G6WAG1_9ACTN|nr:dipeptide epimerase [Nocardioides anomalus]QIG42222.1 dipeptide epimerase [Nocardioides anomalus]